MLDLPFVDQVVDTLPTCLSRAVNRRSKLTGAYRAEFDRALPWATLPTAERAQAGTERPFARSEAPEPSSRLA
jgi:hypothetical protein